MGAFHINYHAVQGHFHWLNLKRGLGAPISKLKGDLQKGKWTTKIHYPLLFILNQERKYKIELFIIVNHETQHYNRKGISNVWDISRQKKTYFFY